MNHYMFMGRTFPEQVVLSLGKHSFRGTVGEPSVCFDLNFQIATSVVVAEVDTESSDVETLKNTIQYVINGIVSAWGFANGLSLSVDITASMDERNHINHFVGPNPNFSFENSEEVLSKVIDALLSNPQLNGYLIRSLADYNQAINVPHDTGFYCYRSIEGLSQAFHSSDISAKEKWEKFRSALNIEEAFIKWLTSYAEPQRHGHLPFMSWNERCKAIKTTQKVIGRFLDYMKENAPLDTEKFPFLTLQ